MNVKPPLDRYIIDFPRSHSLPITSGMIKHTCHDFQVKEYLDLSFSGAGEHLYLYIEKVGQNTEFVAKRLANYFGVRAMDVGFSGLKDRWALTQQWFSIYLGNKTAAPIEHFELDGVKILEHNWHDKKLRRGTHQANHFTIRVTNIAEIGLLEQPLRHLQMNGFPNYFGAQRFGREGANVRRAVQYFAGEIKASRSQRAFYLSAARSYLFNQLLAAKISDNSWSEEGVEGPLYGDAHEGTIPLDKAEQDFFATYPELVKGIHKNRMTLHRRPYRMKAEQFSWQSEDQVLTLSFMLPAGVFATSLVQELLEVEVMAHGDQ
jgi:tRNA pseudouridine13 synthase